jgi:hypothetical protein
MNPVREIAYQLDPALWMLEVLGIAPHAWQEEFLRAERGASIAVLTANAVISISLVQKIRQAPGHQLLIWRGVGRC